MQPEGRRQQDDSMTSFLLKVNVELRDRFKEY